MTSVPWVPVAAPRTSTAAVPHSARNRGSHRHLSPLNRCINRARRVPKSSTGEIINHQEAYHHCGWPTQVASIPWIKLEEGRAFGNLKPTASLALEACSGPLGDRFGNLALLPGPHQRQAEKDASRHQWKAQVELLWRVARNVFSGKSGGSWNRFQDSDPFDLLAPQTMPQDAQQPLPVSQKAAQQRQLRLQSGIKDRLPWVRRRRKKRSPRQTIHEHSSTGRR